MTGNHTAGVLVMTLSFISCVTSDQSLGLSGPQCYYLRMKGKEYTTSRMP